MTSIVEIRDLFVRREKRVVLEIGCLSIEKGQVLAVAGPNGAGKTTLLLVLGRLLKPERGELQFDGQPVKSISDLDYRRHIGVVMQDSLLLNLSVFDNVSIGLQFRHLPKTVVTRCTEEWLERLGIFLPAASSSPATLRRRGPSRGARPRLCPPA